MPSTIILILTILRWMLIILPGGLWAYLAIFNGWVGIHGGFRKGYRGPSFAPIGGTVYAAGCCALLALGDLKHWNRYLVALGLAAAVDVGSLLYLCWTVFRWWRESRGSAQNL